MDSFGDFRRMTTYRKKLIEVALPLDAINKASAREKSIRHGHPSTLHLWWARRPLAACRAVLFASLVNDPDDDPMYGHDEGVAATERAKLFGLIEDLVLWENSNNPEVINRARLEIARSIAANKVADGELQDDTQLVAAAPELPEEQAKYLPDPPPEYTPHDLRFKMPGVRPEQVNHFLAHYAPPVLDPFAGGGSIPLEAQRLGLRAYASDLNPVPVLINKALIEIPPKFANMPPVNPDARKGTLKTKQWHGAQGLAEDVRYYGKWMRDEAEKRIGHLYPKVKVTQEMVDDGRPDLEPYVGKELTVIAWLWCRTVKCANPACGHFMPMARSFWLCSKKGKATYAEPILDPTRGTVRFAIHTSGEPKEETSNRQMARCLFCNNIMKKPQLRLQASEYGMPEIPFAVVAEGNRSRVYLEMTGDLVPNVEKPEASAISQFITDDKRWFSPPQYGLPTFRHLFTPRQLTALVTLSDLVNEARAKALTDAEQARRTDSHKLPAARAEYATAIATYLAFSLSKAADYWSNLCSWHSSKELIRNTFGRQALPMVWDFAEANPFQSGTGGFGTAWTQKVVATLPGAQPGTSFHHDATTSANAVVSPAICTDPPYYDNIGYADLSDYFYLWLRRSLHDLYPELLSTMLTPKNEELIASAHRHGGNKSKAARFFEEGLGKAIGNWSVHAYPTVPSTIFYAFKQAETDSSGTASTGWETFLAGIIEHGFTITATWPMRTEMGNRMVGSGTNALASSIVLACVPRTETSTLVARRDFANALHKELPEAIKHLQSGNVAPVDLAQASIGPGMAVFSRYSKVVNTDGSPMSVREALQLINQVLDESLNEQESDFDSESRFAIRWFEQYGMQEGPFGDAETLSKAMAVSVQGIMEAGIVHSHGGKVRLLRRDELDINWDVLADDRLTNWEVTQHLIRKLEADGESGAAELLAAVQKLKGSEYAEYARELAYRLYSTCERKDWAKEALSYNSLVVSWPEISKLAHAMKDNPKIQQQEMF